MITVILFFSIPVFSQDTSKFNLYKPGEDAESGVANALIEAKEKGKFVFVQIGGNWCSWCARFYKLITTDKDIDSIINKNFVVYHLNYSSENKNYSLMLKYRFPNRFGFPVFLILNETGELLHTQNSVYLEEGKGYNRMKVMEFLKDWSPGTLNPLNYDWIKVKEE